MSRIGDSARNSSNSDQIKVLESEIAKMRQPEEPLTAERFFENKIFNQIKQKMPHLPSKDIHELIQSKWKYGISDKERQEFYDMAE